MKQLRFLFLGLGFLCGSVCCIGQDTEGEFGPVDFPVPGPGDPHLKNTRELVEAFLKEDSIEGILPLVYQSKRLRAKMNDYHHRRPVEAVPQFTMKLFQWEADEAYGGPFWVYHITEPDKLNSGYPIIVRVEDGLLKIDWETFTEFRNRHFSKYLKGKNREIVAMRLVAQQVAPAGLDALKTHLCYELNPPYGAYGEFATKAYVKKGTKLAVELNRLIALGDSPLAVIFELRRDKSNRINITKVIAEGWFTEDSK